MEENKLLKKKSTGQKMKNFLLRIPSNDLGMVVCAMPVNNHSF
jgi:hypothetical protein